MDNYSVAVDVGGTFTDVVLCNLDTNEQSVFKTPSTPDDPSAWLLTGLRRILQLNGVEPAQVKHIFPGTTNATNANPDNKVSRVGVWVTEGFKSVLEIAPAGTPPLVNPNPFSEIERDPCTGLLYFSGVGFFGVLDAGVEMVNPLTLQSMCVIFADTEQGGDFLCG